MTLSDLKMTLPSNLAWKEDSLSLPTYCELAIGILRSLVNRHIRKPEHLTEYEAVMQDQLQKGITEVVPDEGSTFKH